MKKKMIVVLNVEESYSNANGIIEAINGAFGPDEVTVQNAHEFEVEGEEAVLTLTEAAIMADIEQYDEEENKNWTVEQKKAIASAVSDSESLSQFLWDEIAFWEGELKGEGAI